MGFHIREHFCSTCSTPDPLLLNQIFGVFPENVPEFDQGDVSSPGTGQKTLNPLVWRLGLDPRSQPGLVRPETDINDGLDAFRQKYLQKIVWVPAAVANGVKFHSDLAIILFYSFLQGFPGAELRDFLPGDINLLPRLRVPSLSGRFIDHGEGPKPGQSNPVSLLHGLGYHPQDEINCLSGLFLGCDDFGQFIDQILFVHCQFLLHNLYDSWVHVRVLWEYEENIKK